VDTRDKFIEVLQSGGTPGTAAGDGTASDVITSGAAGTHDHDNGNKCNDCSDRNCYHAGFQANHTHTLSFNSGTMPPYWAMNLIMMDN